MIDRSAQRERAEALRTLHRGPDVLVLPNVWDPLGARMLERLGYPAVATASAAVAWSLGYDDGQLIRYDTMLGIVRRIAASVAVPLSADIERGYADGLDALADNIRALIDTGAVGLNLEDSLVEGGALRPIAEQCDRLQAVRAAAESSGIPLVINARTDVFLASDTREGAARMEDAIARGRAYLAAGADCIYPIGLADLGSLVELREALGAPINVYASPNAPSVAELKTARIARLSFGPTVLKAALATCEAIATSLKDGTYTHPDTVDVARFVAQTPEVSE